MQTLNTMYMTPMPFEMMWPMGLIFLFFVILLFLGIAALVKYLRS
jgi:hypothetical protein